MADYSQQANRMNARNVKLKCKEGEVEMMQAAKICTPDLRQEKNWHTGKTGPEPQKSNQQILFALQ